MYDSDAVGISGTESIMFGMSREVSYLEEERCLIHLSALVMLLGLNFTRAPRSPKVARQICDVVTQPVKSMPR